MSKTVAGPAKRNPYAAPIGGVFIILCVIGFVTLVVMCFNFTRGLLDNSAKKAEYEKMLLPVVMFGPVPFEGVENFDKLSLLQTCIWATLLGENRDLYQYDDNGMLVVPTSDVDVTATRLFGPGAKLEHTTFGNFDDAYLYDEAIKSYHVPVTTLTGFVTPKVTDISKKGDVVTLRVGYVPPSTALNLGGEEHAPEPNKFMIYELHKVKGGDYYLYAIRDVEGAGMVPGAPDPVMPWQDELGQGSSAGDLLPETPGTSGDSGSSDDASSGGESAPEEEGEDTGDSGDSSAGEESEPSSSSAPMEG